MTDWQLERRDIERRHLIRQTLDAAESRARERSAKEAYAAYLAEQSRGQDDVIPDADDSSTNMRGLQ